MDANFLTIFAGLMTIARAEINTSSPDSSCIASATDTAADTDADLIRWFALRDLKRPNAARPAWKALPDAGFEVFTPMHTILATSAGRSRRITKPVLPDLLFVRSCRRMLDPVIDRTPTLQYRFMRNAFRRPMTVPEADMRRFIHAVLSAENPRFFRPDEITASMLGREIEIIGGPLDGYSGRLLKMRGSRKRRLIVSLPHLFSAAVEVNPDFIRIVPGKGSGRKQIITTQSPHTHLNI